ncbi:SAM-dependent methyltransferase [Nannocystis punicea]|uniref:SAM-dependent methyltransferase n=1 Tax=Nannocystis punicea TaxID=2995304 RepID=A0ABY7HCI2_9BACT|nr:SAM-dependent methyltransferase [Nannocystis poenicansa]WAS96982.1 SAM-dependent methyltransferase [Nannocystis poenicansa]
MSDHPPRREVVHGDALAWLVERPGLQDSSVIATMPDVSELGVSLDRWREFFLSAARAVLLAAPDDGLAVFIQTDNKHEGRWVSKAGLVLRVADELDVPLLFHKIVCRRPPGSLIHGRPGYSHILAFSRRARDDADRPTPDVLPDLGAMPWSHSIGTRAAEAAVTAVRRLSPATTQIVVPFCGLGTILAVANGHGFDAVGIERNRKRADAARTFELDPNAA